MVRFIDGGAKSPRLNPRRPDGEPVPFPIQPGWCHGRYRSRAANVCSMCASRCASSAPPQLSALRLGNQGGAITVFPQSVREEMRGHVYYSVQCWHPDLSHRPDSFARLVDLSRTGLRHERAGTSLASLESPNSSKHPSPAPAPNPRRRCPVSDAGYLPWQDA